MHNNDEINDTQLHCYHAIVHIVYKMAEYILCWMLISDIILLYYFLFFSVHIYSVQIFQPFSPFHYIIFRNFPVRILMWLCFLFGFQFGGGHLHLHIGLQLTAVAVFVICDVRKTWIIHTEIDFNGHECTLHTFHRFVLRDNDKGNDRISPFPSTSGVQVFKWHRYPIRNFQPTQNMPPLFSMLQFMNEFCDFGADSAHKWSNEIETQSRIASVICKMQTRNPLTNQSKPYYSNSISDANGNTWKPKVSRLLSFDVNLWLSYTQIIIIMMIENFNISYNNIIEWHIDWINIYYYH